MKAFLSFLFLLTLLLSACLPVDAPNAGPRPAVDEAPVSGPDAPVSSDEDPAPQAPDYAPQPGDERLLPGSIYINSREVLNLESYPPQFVLAVSGDLPDPCHQLRARISPPNEDGRIDVNLYALVEPDTMCMQVLKPFEISIALGSFPPGKYEVYLNGEKVADLQF